MLILIVFCITIILIILTIMITPNLIIITHDLADWAIKKILEVMRVLLKNTCFLDF